MLHFQNPPLLPLKEEASYISPSLKKYLYKNVGLPVRGSPLCIVKVVKGFIKHKQVSVGLISAERGVNRYGHRRHPAAVPGVWGGVEAVQESMECCSHLQCVQRSSRLQCVQDRSCLYCIQGSSRLQCAWQLLPAVYPGQLSPAVYPGLAREDSSTLKKPRRKT